MHFCGSKRYVDYLECRTHDFELLRQSVIELQQLLHMTFHSGF